jgi:hypothetical protein
MYFGLKSPPINNWRVRRSARNEKLQCATGQDVNAFPAIRSRSSKEIMNEDEVGRSSRCKPCLDPSFSPMRFCIQRMISIHIAISVLLFAWRHFLASLILPG